MSASRKIGRPCKGQSPKVALNSWVAPSTKAGVDLLRGSLNLSRGEVLDRLHASFLNSEPKPVIPTK